MFVPSDFLSFTHFVPTVDLVMLAKEDVSNPDLPPLPDGDSLVALNGRHDELMLDFLGCIDSNL